MDKRRLLKTRNGHALLTLLAVAIVVLQMALILFSCIINVIEPSLPVRSMLSGEGVRWLFGGLVSSLCSPLLVWLVLCSVAWGSFLRSRLYGVLLLVLSHKPVSFRCRHALFTSAALLFAMTIGVVLLAFIPHAELLGVTGELYPSAFSDGLIPLLAFIVTAVSVVYGVVSGELSSVQAVYASLCYGLRKSAPLFPLYILAMQFYGSICFVLF